MQHIDEFVYMIRTHRCFAPVANQVLNSLLSIKNMGVSVASVTMELGGV